MKSPVQPRHVLIIARDLGDSLEVILRTDDFDKACQVFLEEWSRDRRVVMLDYTPAVIIAACALRYYRGQQWLEKSWPAARQEPGP